MGRYVSVQAYGDNNPKVVQVPYEQATGGREPGQSGGRDRNKVEKVENVMGSTAGAGSGEFHTYRAHRRTEMFRIEGIEKQAQEDEEQAIFEAKVAQKRKETEERAQKNAEKRKRKKMKKAQQGKSGDTKEAGGQGDSDSQDGEPDRKKAGGVPVYEVPVIIKDDGSFLETMKQVLASKSGSSGGKESQTGGAELA